MKGTWYNRLTRILSWGFIARSAAPALLLLLVYSLHLFWIAATELVGRNQHVFSPEVMQQALPTIYLIMAGAAGILCLGYLLHRFKKEPLWYQHLNANYYSLSLLWGGYLTGSLSLAAGTVLMGAPLLGFILLERRVVMLAFIIAVVTLLGINLASAYGLVPYSPLLLPPAAQRDAVMWTHSQFFMAAPHLVVDVVVAALLIGQWRLREEQARRLSLTDALTRIHNRRSILRKLDKEVSRAQRRGQPLAVAVIDLDHFKRINDGYGHLTGDRVLCACARTLQSEIRTSDAVGRLGGEEFLLVLPNTSAHDAFAIVERCRARILAMLVESDEGLMVPVTASIGLCCTDPGDDIEAAVLISHADKALYAAKQSGRNQVKVATRELPLQVTRNMPSLPVQWHWKQFLTLRGWRAALRDILAWSPVSKAMLMATITAYIALNTIVALSLFQRLDNIESVADISAGMLSRQIAMVVLAVAIILIISGNFVRRRWPGSKLYQSVTLQFFGLTLVALGYGVGILYMPTGIMLLCSPIIGFMLFERRLVLEVFLVALTAVVALAYLSAYNIIPYAPVLATHVSIWQVNIPLLTFGIYFFVTFCVIVSFILVDNILGSWREREAEFQRSSRIDALTQIMNRRSILEELDAAISYAKRQREGVAVALLDLDHFKQTNDRHGHPVGDAVLVAAASQLSDCLRDGDAIGRYGGEEFLLVMRHVDATQAQALSERCRTGLMQCQVSNEDGQPVAVSGSFGVAYFGGDTDTDAASLIRLADEALYQAKEAGRNRVAMAASSWSSARAT